MSFGRPDWTLSELVAVCKELEPLVRTGTVPGLMGVLPPVLYMYDAGLARSDRTVDQGVIALPWNWVPFVQGFGGSFVSDGAVAFDAAALTGLAAYVDLLRRFAPPAAVPSDLSSASGALTDAFALSLQLWSPAATVANCSSATEVCFDARWAWARFARLPVQPVIPTDITGFGLANAAGREPPSTTSMWPPAGWSGCSRPPRSILLQAHDWVPVVADAAVQSAFWKARSVQEQEGGDWAHCAPWSEGWPGCPPTTFMTQALVGAVAAPTQLEALLTAAPQ